MFCNLKVLLLRFYCSCTYLCVCVCVHACVHACGWERETDMWNGNTVARSTINHWTPECMQQTNEPYLPVNKHVVQAYM